jgi:hypothetical protein
MLVRRDEQVSKTVSISFGDRWFWAYDVSFSILLLEAIHVAESVPPNERAPWQDNVLDTLRMHVLLGANVAFPLDGEWDEAQRQYVLTLIADAGQHLRQRRRITAAEAAELYVLDGEPVFLRGADSVDTTAIADLADAIVSMVRGDLPSPPPARVWFFGVEGGPRTL